MTAPAYAHDALPRRGATGRADLKYVVNNEDRTLAIATVKMGVVTLTYASSPKKWCQEEIASIVLSGGRYNDDVIDRIKAAAIDKAQAQARSGAKPFEPTETEMSATVVVYATVFSPRLEGGSRVEGHGSATVAGRVDEDRAVDAAIEDARKMRDASAV